MSIFSIIFFIAWGPFALPNDCFQVMNISGSKASINMTRGATMMKDKMEKTTKKGEYITSRGGGESCNITMPKVQCKQCDVKEI